MNGIQFTGQDVFTMETFTVKVLEILILLEKEAYLKGAQCCNDIGNGSYPRSFKTLNKHSLLVNIPRTRSGHFKPMTIELLKMQQEQVNELALLLYRKGLNSRDVSDIMQDFFGKEMSYETVNNLSDLSDTDNAQKCLNLYSKIFIILYCNCLILNVIKCCS